MFFSACIPLLSRHHGLGVASANTVTITKLEAA